MEAAKTIASLVAKLSLDSSEFSAGMEKAKASMSIKEAVSTTGKAFAMVGGAAVAAAGLTAKAAIDFESSFAGVRKTVEAPIGTNANEFFQGLENDMTAIWKKTSKKPNNFLQIYQITLILVGEVSDRFFRF